MKVQNIVAITWTYTNKSGEEKKQYTTIGKLLTKDNGNQSIKIETVPLWWDWWASIYDQKDQAPKLASDTNPDEDLSW